MGILPADDHHTDQPHDIFLSYSRQDLALMQQVKAALEGVGFRVWIDQTELEPGTPSWTGAIESAIESAGCLLVVLSPTAKKSKWVREEMEYARSQDKRIFGALAKGKPNNALPFGYSTLQFSDLTNPATYPAELRKLVNAIAKHLDRTDLLDAEALLDDDDALAPDLDELSELTPPPPPPTPVPPLDDTPPFTGLNPLNWLRVLWWLFMDARRYDPQRHGAAGAWLASSLVWGPLFLLVMAGTLGGLPVDFEAVRVGAGTLTADSATLLGALLSVLIAVWLVTWGMVRVDSQQAVSVVVPMVVTLLLVAILGLSLGAIEAGVVGSVALALAMGVGAVVVGAVTRSTLRGVGVGVMLGMVGGLGALLMGNLVLATLIMTLYALIHIELGEAWSPRKGRALMLGSAAALIGGVVGGLQFLVGAEAGAVIADTVLGVLVGALYGVLLGVSHQVVHGVYRQGVAALERDRRTGEASLVSIALFGVLIVAGALVVWVAFLGGGELLP